MGKKDVMDKKVMDLITTVKERRAKIEKLTKPQWRTSCSLTLPGMPTLNIQVEQQLSLLAIACGTLLRIRNDIEAAAKELEVVISPLWQSYDINDWVEDIKLRVRVTQIKTEKEKLMKMESKLKELTSEDQRRAMALAEIEKDLK